MKTHYSGYWDFEGPFQSWLCKSHTIFKRAAATRRLEVGLSKKRSHFTVKFSSLTIKPISVVEPRLSKRTLSGDFLLYIRLEREE